MIARNDSAYKDQSYWRGRIWAPANFLAYLALRRCNKREPCKILAEKSLNLLMKEWIEKGHVHENYNGDTGEGCDVRTSDKFYYWGGLLSYIALIENGYIEGPEKSLRDCQA
jgi:glycogen debranching enzyme